MKSLFAAVLLLSSVSLFAVENASLPVEGSPAPAFKLPSQDSPAVALDQFRGKWVVLYFYPKDFTGGCTIEAHNFQRDLAKFEKENAVVAGVSVDSVDSHKGFCTKEGLNFKLLSDTSKQVTAQYESLSASGEYAMRNTFLIDPKGVVRKVYTKVDPNSHSEAVLADLAKLEESK